MDAPQPEAVREQVTRIVTSELFENAPVLRRFLSHVVDRALDGTEGELKEYSLGLEVFERGDAFDPRTDTIVRVQARRLREKLKTYYDTTGRADPIKIDLPKGAYVPEWRFNDLTGSGATGPAPKVASGAEGRSRGPRRGTWQVLAIGCALGAAAVLLWVGLFEPAPQVMPVTRFELRAPDGLPFVIRENTRDIAISPDGRFVAYVTQSGTMVLWSLERREARVLEGVRADTSPFFSPDGQWVGYVTDALDGAGSVNRIAVAGGSSERVAPLQPAAFADATWGSDDTIFAADVSGIWRVSASGGEPELIAVPDFPNEQFGWIDALPDNAGLLYTIVPAGAGIESAQVAVLDFRTGSSEVLVRGATQPRYVRTGHLVYATANTLQAVRFNVDSLRVEGEPVEVVSSVEMSPNGSADYGVSDTGTLIYVPQGVSVADRTLVWVDRDGVETPIDAPPMNVVYPRVSPDGTRVALDVREPVADIWVWDLEREVLSRVTDDPWDNPVLEWSADGKRIAYGDRQGEFEDVYWRRADAATEPEPLIQGAGRQFPNSFTPDGKDLVFWEAGNLYLVSLDEARAVRSLLQTSTTLANASVSPDGRWLAYESDETGRNEVYLRPFPDVDDGRWRVSADGGVAAAWAPDGSELYYLDPSPAMVAVSIGPGVAPLLGTPTRLFPVSEYGPQQAGARVYDVSPDGRFLMLRRAASNVADATPRIEVVVNWFAELEGLVQR